MIYVYSDTHFDHEAIIKYCNRLPDWQERFLALHRKIIGPKDTVLFLGDLGFGPCQRMREILDSLTYDSFVAILGNHDKSSKWLLESSVDVVLNQHGQKLHIYDPDYPVDVVMVAKDEDPRPSVYFDKNPVIAISHEPYENITWPYLRGHTHNNPIPWGYDGIPYNLHRGMGRNVSVEAINYTPVPIPFLIGDDAWIRKNYKYYYKHIFDYEAKR